MCACFQNMLLSCILSLLCTQHTLALSYFLLWALIYCEVLGKILLGGIYRLVAPLTPKQSFPSLEGQEDEAYMAVAPGTHNFPFPLGFGPIKKWGGGEAWKSLLLLVILMEDPVSMLRLLCWWISAVCAALGGRNPTAPLPCLFFWQWFLAKERELFILGGKKQLPPLKTFPLRRWEPQSSSFPSNSQIATHHLGLRVGPGQFTILRNYP